MARLQFQTSELDQRFVHEGEGAAFQQFIFEVIEPSFPHLHRYPAGGKDGGIDHITDEAGKPRVVIECKLCGTDGIEEARKRWKVTKGNLEENLASADGPGQSQYRPWYRADEPIVRYLFTTSARLENAARVDELRDEIRAFFHGLAAKHPHLAHLGGLVVEVHDWNYIEGRVPAFLRFRWFPGERPAGLRLLNTEDESATGFRAWLRSSTLPFYSRATHLLVDPAPHSGDLPDEKALLGALSTDSGTLGLVLVGRGGVGKTRLALEIGHTAAADGWSVWVVRRRLKPETIDQLAARMDAGTRVLLIFDYVETHPEFANVVQHLADIVDDTDHCLRYVATCRSSYYNAIKGADRQRVVALSAAKPGIEEWLIRYRRATVEHILRHAGIPINEHNTRACHDLPVLAAFLHWLHHRGRTEELETLLGDEDFGRWVIHRVQLSFPDRKLDHSLARLVALFPIPAAGRDALTDDERDLFYCLEQDGWIERADDPTAGATAWQTAHDVLADRVALEWLETIGSAAAQWCAELLREAVRFHALPSALRSLQRLAEHLLIDEAEWETLLITEIKRAPNEWRALRSMVLRTSLLSAPSRVRLLTSLTDVFAGAEVEGDFHSALGDLLRQMVETQSASSLRELERKTLFEWVRRSIPNQRNLQYLRAWAVRVAPDEFRSETLAFLESRAEKLPTQYVLCAWIYAKLPTVLIENPIRTWCSAHSTKIWFSFVAEAWLSGKGDPLVIQPFLYRWFERFLSMPRASFVLGAWLEHANAPETFKKKVTQWLDEHGKTPEAEFVLSAWLEHANAPETFKEKVTQWLDEHGTTLEASYVLGAWLEHANAPETFKEKVTQWLDEHGTTLEARFVLSAWLEHANAPETFKEKVTQWLDEHGTTLEARFVLGAWLEHANAPETFKEKVTQWLDEHGETVEASYVLRAWLEHANAPETFKEKVTQWLDEHGKTPDASYVLRAWLEHANAPEILKEKVAQWLDEHGKTPDASYVLSAWLGHANAPETFKEKVAQWLDEHGKTPEAQFVLSAWLEHAKAPETFKEEVAQWLDEHGKTLEARFVLGAWLEHANAPETFKEKVTQWLDEHGKTPEATYLLSRWLDFDGELYVIELYIRKWLPIYGQTFEDGSYVLRTWLRSGAVGRFAEPFVLAWLNVHGETLDAQFVLAAWLKAKNSPEPIAEHVASWMEQHGTTKECSHVLGPWLDQHGSFAVVRPFIAPWLTDHGDDYDAWHVLAACLRADSGRAEIRDAAIQWCELHASKFHASFVLDPWLNKSGEPGKVSAYVEAWLAAHGADYQASRIICAWIDHGGSLDTIRDATLGWLQAQPPRTNTSWVLVSWLRAGGDRDAVESHVRRHLANSDNPQSVTVLRQAWEVPSRANQRRAGPPRL